MLIFALAACSRARARKHVYDFLARYSLVSLAVKGRDLRDLGIPEGPAYSMILRTLRREKLDKNLTTKREEMRAVKNIIALYKEKNRAIFDGNI
jgi:tRNA nucleotidyltransferase (CCA-adding enzyme)